MRAWTLPLAAIMAMGMLLGGTPPAPAFEQDPGDRPMTRRDFLQVLYPVVKRMESQGAIARTGTPSLIAFADLEGRERDWAVELASQFHLFNAMPALSSGRFNASLPLSRWEAGLILGELLHRTHPEALKLAPAANVTPEFSDLSPGERIRLGPLLKQGFVIGFPDQTFRAQEPLTQAQWESVARRLSALDAFKAAPLPPARKAPALADDYRLLPKPGTR